MTDYHDFTTKDMPQKQRRKLGVGDWWMNSAQCTECQRVMISRNRHDFVTCVCGKLSIDGGSWYLRRVGEASVCKDLSVKYDEVRDDEEEAL